MIAWLMRLIRSIEDADREKRGAEMELQPPRRPTPTPRLQKK